MKDFEKKSSLQEIKERFDADVERFSNLQTGQSATIDATLAMDLITRAAFVNTPTIENVLDIGCGAGNNTLKLLELSPNFNSDLLDLSPKMLVRAKERISLVSSGKINTFEGDFRKAKLKENHYDVVLAAAVLHHLRDDADWEFCFSKIYKILKPNGTLWITDLVSHETAQTQKMMWEKYGEYLETLGGANYKEKVFAYIEKEDSPRPLTYQLDLLKKVGFKTVEVLHKNSCFAAFGAIK